MAETDVLKSFLVGIGFQTDQASLRRAQEGLKTAETQVKRFAQATHRSTTLWGQFFHQFQRAEGPQRQHIEIAQRLNKAYELFGISLKNIATLALGGTISAAFIGLTNEFNKVYYAAQQAGTTVQSLLGLQFGGARVGIGAQEITSDLINLRRAFEGIPGPGIAQMFQGLGLDVIDPATGKIREIDKTLENLLRNLSKMYHASPAGPGLAQQILGTGGVPLTPALEQLLKFPELIDEMVKGAGQFENLRNRIGVNLTKLADDSRGLTNQWQELMATFGLFRDALAAPWVEPAGAALKKFEEWALHAEEIIKEFAIEWQKAFARGGTEGLGKTIADDILHAFGAVNWSELGKKAGAALAAAFKSAFRDEIDTSLLDPLMNGIADFGKGLANRLLDAIREQLQKFPWLQWMPGVGAPNTTSPPAEVQGPSAPPQRQLHPGWLHPREEPFRAGGVPPEGVASPLPPKMQTGGVVPILAHAGEVVLGADLVRMMTDWLRGGGAYRPLVHVENTEDFARSFEEATPGEGERGPGFGRPRHGDPFSLSPRRGSTPGIGDPKTALSAIEKFESGGRNIMNYIGDALHTASGFFQITNSTWREIARRYGVDTSGYTRAMDAPRGLQERAATALYQHEGWGPWAPYNARLRSFLRSHPGFPEDRPALGAATASAPLGTTNTWHAGDRTVTVNAQSNFHISGNDAQAIGGTVNSVASRQNADLIRNLTPIVQ